MLSHLCQEALKPNHFLIPSVNLHLQFLPQTSLANTQLVLVASHFLPDMHSPRYRSFKRLPPFQIVCKSGDAARTALCLSKREQNTSVKASRNSSSGHEIDSNHMAVNFFSTMCFHAPLCCIISVENNFQEQWLRQLSILLVPRFASQEPTFGSHRNRRADFSSLFPFPVVIRKNFNYHLLRS